ncbi:MAG: PIN domain-containing protein [Deltaproteobacteria bacterium]|nr:MAG: PIN domain-containing protein [Deltaproteobacteria bacterium]
MAGDVVLVDTGPLVALLDPSDTSRAACRACLDALERSDLVTTEAVVTEAAYLLNFSTQAQVALLRLLASGRPRVEALSSRDRLRAAELLAKYADLPMDYADASLVVLAERLRARAVFTLDRKDFAVYRVGRARIRIIPD